MYELHLTLDVLTFAGLLCLVTGGFTVAIGLMRVVNLALGTFYLFGGYIAATVIIHRADFWLGLLAGALAAALLALPLDVLLSRVRTNEFAQVLLTLGIFYIGAQAMIAVFGASPVSVVTPGYLNGSVTFGSLNYPVIRLVIGIAGFAAMALLFWIQERTPVGTQVRAGVDDEEIARSMGIPVHRLFRLLLLASGFLAGLAGGLGGSFLGLAPGQDQVILLYALVVVVIGGLGSLGGALLGSLVVSAFATTGQVIFPALAPFAEFLPMLVILILRPRGILGRGRL